MSKIVILFIFLSTLLFSSEELKLTPAQKEFLQINNKIHYVYDPSWKPFEWKSELETHVGMIYDILYIVQKRSGLELVPVKTESWIESIQSIKSGSVPMVSAIGITKKRAEYLRFSKNPLFKVPYVIVSRQGEDYLDGCADIITKRVATIESSTIEELLLTEKKELSFSLVKSVKDGFYALQNKDIDAFVVNMATAKYYINFLGFKDLKIAYKTDLTLDLRVAINKNSPKEGLEIIDKALEQIDPKEIEDIFKKWTELKVKKEIDWEFFSYLFAGVFIVIVLLLLHTRRLNSMVQRQTSKINEQKIELEKLIESYDKYVVASTTDLEGKIIYASKAYCKKSGYRLDELIGSSHSIVRHPDSEDSLFAKLWETIEANKVWRGEIKNLAKDKHTYWEDTIISPVYNSNGVKYAYSAIRQDITDRKAIEELVIRDGLTNIYNRRHFNEYFPKFINRAKRNNELISFLSLDIDYFKAYNDTYGHQKGDDVLISFATVLNKLLRRADDKCFRLGGEEFGVVFMPLSEENALSFAQSIEKAVRDLHIVHKRNATSEYLTCSMGLVTKKAQEIASVDSIYKEADDLLYKAKQGGRNMIVSNSSV